MKDVEDFSTCLLAIWFSSVALPFPVERLGRLAD